MSETHEKGAFRADIPLDAVEEALRSVDKVKHGGEAPAAGAGQEGVALEVEAEGAGAPPADAAALAARVESLEAQLALSQEKSRETMDRLKDTHERHLRAAADLENYRRRAQKEKEEIQKFGVEKLLKDLFPVVDNLDRALGAAPDDGPLRKGVEMVRASLEQALARHGAKAFSALGQPFDPARHEALLQVPTAEAAPGTVVLEHARGFTLHDRLARPAMVGVAVAVPAGGDAGVDAGGASGEAGTAVTEAGAGKSE